MNRKKAKKKAQSRDCSCVLGKDRDNNYNSVIDKVFDDHEAQIEELKKVTLGLPYVSKCYSEKDMDNAYDKGFKDGNQRDRE
tara:strand:- start:99 stop:344 length:246 start_codon:yes stop_codon:yes gene_type:complete